MNRIEREKQPASTQPITLIHLLAKREDIFPFASKHHCSGERKISLVHIAHI